MVPSGALKKETWFGQKQLLSEAENTWNTKWKCYISCAYKVLKYSCTVTILFIQFMGNTLMFQKILCSVKKQFILILELPCKTVQSSEYLNMAKKNKDGHLNIFFSFMMNKIAELCISQLPGSWDFSQWHLPSGSCSLWNELSLVVFSDGTWMQRNSQLIEIENGRWIPHSWQRATEITGATSWEIEPSTWGKMSNVLPDNIWTACAIL